MSLYHWRSVVLKTPRKNKRAPVSCDSVFYSNSMQITTQIVRETNFSRYSLTQCARCVEKPTSNCDDQGSNERTKVIWYSFTICKLYAFLGRLGIRNIELALEHHLHWWIYICLFPQTTYLTAYNMHQVSSWKSNRILTPHTLYISI